MKLEQKACSALEVTPWIDQMPLKALIAFHGTALRA
jgi:hypothetical protein